MFYSHEVNVIVTVKVQPDDDWHSLLLSVDVSIFCWTLPYEHDITIFVIDTISYCEYDMLPDAVNSESLTRLNCKLTEPDDCWLFCSFVIV